MPTAAEELAQHSQVRQKEQFRLGLVPPFLSPAFQVLEPSVIKRFDGLMRPRRASARLRGLCVLCSTLLAGT